MNDGLKASDVVGLLGLTPHPEGGWFRETYRQDPGDGGRGASTAIYYLLAAGDRSAWHRVVDADEVWHWYAGDALALRISPDGTGATECRLGPDLIHGERPQAIVPAGHWQSAEPRGAWTLVGCTVAPAFSFDAFELAPDGWMPSGAAG